MKRLAELLLVLLLMLLAGCGGGGNGGGGGNAVKVSISPNTNPVKVGVTLTQQFTATVTNTTNTAVTWSISGSGCTPAAACGTISASGLYTAPSTVPNPATLSVTATSQADPTKSASVNVKVVPITVSVSPANATVALTFTQQFAATVSPSTAVTWSLSGTGCVGAACGAIDNTGLYTAPSTMPAASTVIVTATSTASSTAVGTATVNLVHVAVTVLPSTTTVGLTGTQQFTALVSPTTPVNWTVSCSAIPCGTVNSSGLYTAPASCPGGSCPATVMVTATSTVDPVGTDSATVTVVASFNSRFTGTFAFRFSGFDANGQVLAAGNFAADGNGNITGGLMDVNRFPTPPPTNPVTISGGSYTVQSDNRGTLTLNTSIGAFEYAFAIGSSGEAIFIQTFDSSGNGTRGSGIIDLASAAAFKNSAIKGPYVFGFSGANNAKGRVGEVGLFSADGAGNITAGNLDLNDAATTIQPNQSFTGTYSVASTGRGTAQLTVGATILNYTFYVVVSGQAFWVSTDPVSSASPMLGGLVLSQNKITYSNSTFNGDGVFNLTGLNATTSFNVVSLGILAMDGKGNITSSSVFDRNQEGAITTNQGFSGIYAVTSNGRGTASISSAQKPATLLVFYAVNTRKAFLMDLDPNGFVQTGFIEPQTSGTFSADSLQGSFVFGTTTTANTNATNLSSVLSLDGISSFTGTQDTSATSNQAVSGSYTVSGNGRGTMTVSAPAAENRVLYVASPSKFFAINVDSTNKDSSVLSGAR